MPRGTNYHFLPSMRKLDLVTHPFVSCVSYAFSPWFAALESGVAQRIAMHISHVERLFSYIYVFNLGW